MWDIELNAISSCALLTPFIKLFIKMYMETPNVTPKIATMVCPILEIR
jgi:hypothetical protein